VPFIEVFHLILQDPYDVMDILSFLQMGQLGKKELNNLARFAQLLNVGAEI